MRTTAAMVFRCAASRNKRRGPAVGNGPELPHVAELCADGRPGGTATLDAQAACCGPPVGGVRPARPYGSQKHSPFTVSHSVTFVLGVPPRAANASLYITLFALSLSNSPPAVNATSPDELQSAARGGGELRDPTGRKSTANNSAPRSAQRGGKTGYGFPAQNRHSPKLAPVLRPVSASLRLRCRSAAFPRAWGNLVKTRKRVLTIPLFRRRRAIWTLPRLVLFFL